VTSQAAGDHWEAGELQVFEPPELFLGCRGLGLLRWKKLELPSGYLLHSHGTSPFLIGKPSINYGKSQFSMGKSTI